MGRIALGVHQALEEARRPTLPRRKFRRHARRWRSHQILSGFPAFSPTVQPTTVHPHPKSGFFRLTQAVSPRSHDIAHLHKTYREKRLSPVVRWQAPWSWCTTCGAFGCHASAPCSAPRFSCPPVSGGFSPWFSRPLSRRLCAFYGQPRGWACFPIDVVFASCSSLSLLGLGSRRGLTGVGALGFAWAGVLLLWLLHRSEELWYRAYAHTLPVCRVGVAHAWKRLWRSGLVFGFRDLLCVLQGQCSIFSALYPSTAKLIHKHIIWKRIIWKSIVKYIVMPCSRQSPD